jgi:predicted HTH domain antitoxin
MKTVTVSTRLPPEELASVDELAARVGLDRSGMTKTLLRRGLSELRLDTAAKAYAEGQVTLSRAAEMAGVSLWDFLNRMEQRGLVLHYDVAELAEDLGNVLGEA